MPLVTNVEDLEKIVLEKCDSFVNMGIWPPGEKLSPERWLKNFLPNEREHALYLLNAFTYYNMDMSLSLLKGSIVNLSKKLTHPKTISDIYTNWKKFIEDTIFVPVIGETRNITDSGNLLATHLRKDLLISETKILTVDQLYESTFQSLIRLKKRIVFFDDFVGSGKQFNDMWNDAFTKNGETFLSVRDQCKKLEVETHYCAMIGTSYGIEKIKKKSPEVDLNFSHILQANASPLSTNSTAWPNHLKTSGPEFILNASRRCGIAESELKGHHELGLAIAFSFTMPDATLPIFHTNNSKWMPLMIRS